MAMKRLLRSGAVAAFLLALFLLLSAAYVRADVGELKVEWQRFLPGTSGNSVVQTSDGGYLILGENATLKVEYWAGGEHHSYENFQQILVKIDSQGVFSWSKTIYLDGFDRLAPGMMVETSDGNYAIASVAVNDSDTVKSKVSLMKIDSQGTILWSKLLQGYPPELAEPKTFWGPQRAPA